MTNPRWPSLLQAREPHSHSHPHPHPHPHHLGRPHRHDHDHDQQQSQQQSQEQHSHDTKRTPSTLHDGALPAVDAAADASDSSPLVTKVIQTASLVQVIDAAASLAAKQILNLSNLEIAATKPSSSETVPAPHPITNSTLSTSPQTTNIPSTLSSQATLTPSFPSSKPSIFVSDGRGSIRAPFPHLNGTSARFLIASKDATLTTITTLPISSTLPLASATTTALDSSTGTSSLATIVSTVAVEPIATGGASGGGAGVVSGPAVDDPQPSPATPSNPNDGNLTPQQKQVIGGVVGGVTGAAFFAVFLMLILRYRRRRNSRELWDSAQGTASRGLAPNPRGGGFDGAGTGSMVERDGPPAIAAALTARVEKPNVTPGGSSDGAEKGFYRVSGRKLPSVLQVGGDGYTDPRESTVSSTLDHDRAPPAFEPAQGLTAKLALGNPMRPVSGIPIMRSGPARTPVTEQNPFLDHPRTPPPNEGSKLSYAPRHSPAGSRFHESI